MTTQRADDATDEGKDGRMCGIAGILGEHDHAALERMQAIQRHRGPDQEGTAPAEPGDPLIGHCRLAIIDVEGGRQPMSSEDGQVVLSFNGAIYNHPELRETLTREGHAFRTRSDTEVLLHAYLEWGREFTAHLRGMYALAIWDRRARVLLLARDPSGKKPLHFASRAGRFVFGSEIGAVRAALSGDTTVDLQALRSYLTWGCVPGPSTIYREVRAVRPGEMLEVRDAEHITSKPLHRPTDQFDLAGRSDGAAVDLLDELLREAVGIRLRADVPLGCFLSGGIDSGLITAMAARSGVGRIKTLTVGFEEGAFDERAEARTVADRYGTDHVELVVRPDLEADLPRMIRAYGQPYADSSAIPSFYVAEAARQHVKVVLNGDGGDELFGGYRRYAAARLADMVPLGDTALARLGFHTLAKVLPAPRGHRTRGAFLHRWVRGMSMEPARRYQEWALNGFYDEELRRLGIQETLPSGDDSFLRTISGCTPETGGDGERGSFLANMMRWDRTVTLPNDLLVKMDIACMNAGLESRCPLLDARVAALAESLRPERRVSIRQTKPVLRALARRYLPDTICDAPKRGFEVPLHGWLTGPLHTWVRDVVLAEDGLCRALFSRDGLTGLIEGRWGLDDGQWARRVWMLFALGLWDSECHRNGTRA